MAKTLVCECGTNCGEMEKGRFIKGGVILCPKCAEQHRLLKMMADSRKHGGQNPDWDSLFGKGGDNPFGDLFGDMFKKR